jgi:hypothetical protein
MYAGDFSDHFPDISGTTPGNANTPPHPDPGWVSPLFNTSFYPPYLYKNKAGTAATGLRSQNDVLYCPTDNWHRNYEASTAGVTNLIGYHWLPARANNLAEYKNYPYSQWYFRTKMGQQYCNAPVMCDAIETYGDSGTSRWFVIFNGPGLS